MRDVKDSHSDSEPAVQGDVLRASLLALVCIVRAGSGHICLVRQEEADGGTQIADRKGLAAGGDLEGRHGSCRFDDRRRGTVEKGGEMVR